MGSEALATGRNIITDRADPIAKLLDVVRKNLREAAHSVMKRLSGQGRRSYRATSAKSVEQTTRSKKKRKKALIRDLGMAAEASSVSSEFDIFEQKPVQPVSKIRSKLYSGL
jgi:hypothetical protein